MGIYEEMPGFWQSATFRVSMTTFHRKKARLSAKLLFQSTTIGLLAILIACLVSSCSSKDTCPKGRHRVGNRCVDDVTDMPDGGNTMMMMDAVDHTPVCDPFCKFVATDESGKPLLAPTMFGSAVALDDPYLAIGARQEENYKGAVYLYQRRTNGEWRFKQKLVAPDGTPLMDFGQSLVLDGDRLLVGGAWYDGAGIDSGVLYLYRKNKDGTFQFHQRIVGDDVGAFYYFGFSIALEGKLLAVGSPGRPASEQVAEIPGAVYLFDEQADGKFIGRKQAKIQATLADGTDDKLNDASFGWSLAWHNKRLVVGAMRHDNLAPNPADPPLDRSGVVYVFDANDKGEWVVTAKLLASDPQAGASFGDRVSLRDNLLLVAAPLWDSTLLDVGALYIFTKNSSGAGWTQVAKLVREETRAFARALVRDGTRALIGSHGMASQGAANAGGIFVYSVLASGTLKYSRFLGAPSPTMDDYYSAELALDGRYLVSASPYFHNVVEKNVGAVFIYDNLFSQEH